MKRCTLTLLLVTVAFGTTVTLVSWKDPGCTQSNQPIRVETFEVDFCMSGFTTNSWKVISYDARHVDFFSWNVSNCPNEVNPIGVSRDEFNVCATDPISNTSRMWISGVAHQDVFGMCSVLALLALLICMCIHELKCVVRCLMMHILQCDSITISNELYFNVLLLYCYTDGKQNNKSR